MTVINNLHYNLAPRRSEFFRALPFPYLVLDDFLDAEYFERYTTSVSDLKKQIKGKGKNFNSDIEQGKWISLNSSLPEVIREIIDEMNSDNWVSNLQKLTGIDTLFATKVGNTKLANYHEMKPGGVLGSHVDHAADPGTGLPHVLNILIYLTEGWEVEFGGGTELFDSSGRRRICKVDYKPNRSVIFLHTPFSFHGVERISQQALLTRQSIYVDYYSTSSAPYARMRLPFPNHWFYHPTTFVFESGLSYFFPRNLSYLKHFLIYHLHKTKAIFSRNAQ